MSYLSLVLLGTPIVQLDQRVVTFRTRKALALLVYLAVEGGLHSRDKLVALFWPESGPGQGRATLRSTLAYLRRALDESSPSADDGGNAPYLIVESDILGFNFEADFRADWLTLQFAWTLARSPARVTSAGDLEGQALNSLITQLQTAANLYQGDFLTGFSLEDAPDFDDWTGVQRETCHRRMGLIFDRLSQLQAEGGELINAVETAARWAVLDPLNEIAHRRLMQLHFAAGDRSAAWLAYEACQAILARELNADTSPETQALADRIREFGVQVSGLPLERSEPNRKSELPKEHDAGNRKSGEWPLVGRANEHLALVTAYRAMRRGQPQVVTIEGEPGIGKTRLAREFLGWATAQGADVLQGRAFETSGRLPYQPVIEALRDRLDRENAPDDLLSDRWLAELSRLLPELGERYPDLPLPTAEETTAQTQLFEAVARLGQALAERSPPVLFLDDLQWADATSLDLLHYAARRWAALDTPILLLFTLRSEALELPGNGSTGPGLSEWLMMLRREVPVTRLTLEALSLTDIQRLVQTLDPEPSPMSGETRQQPAFDGSSAVQPFQPSVNTPSGALFQFSQRLLAETGGQPFFLIETLKMLFDSDWPVPDATSGEESGSALATDLDLEAVISRYLHQVDRPDIPRSIQEMIGARLARLSPAAQTACLAAAVLDDNFDFERLCRVAGLAENEGLEALEELLKRGLVREQRQVTARPYVLAHDRFREVVYHQTSQPRRRIFHRRAFEMLEAVAAPPAELARHALAAGLLEQAFDLNVSAGNEALRLYAPQAAIKHFTYALETARQLAISPPPALYHARGRAYETVGAFGQARDDFQQVLKEAQAGADQPGEWRALQDLGFLWASRDYEQAGGYFQQGLALARAAGQPVDLACSLNRVGNWHANKGQPIEAIGFHQEALAIFEALAERPGQAETLDLLAMACYMSGNMQQSLDYYEQAIAIFRESDNRRGLVFGMAMMSMVVRATFTVEILPEADVAQSVPMAKSAAQMAQEIGWRAGESHALVALGQNLYHQGQYGAALEAVRSGLSVAVEIEHPLWMTYAHWVLGLIYLDLLALPEARQHLEQALALAQKTRSIFWLRASTAMLARAYVALSEFREAEAILEAVLGSNGAAPDSVEWPAQTTMQRLVWYARAELALACNEPLLAIQIVEQLIASTTHISKERPVLRLSKLRGEALAAAGRMPEAEAVLRQALGTAQRQDEPPMQWRIHLALGRLYQAQERQTDAAREFASAQTIVEELAAALPDGALRDGFRRNAMIK